MCSVRAVYPPGVWVVVHVASDPVETVRPGLKVITYGTSEGMKSVFCMINPTRAWVNLELSRGTDLPDPRGLLEGTGKHLRHVRVASAKEAKTPALRALVAQAGQTSSTPRQCQKDCAGARNEPDRDRWACAVRAEGLANKTTRGLRPLVAAPGVRQWQRL